MITLPSAAACGALGFYGERIFGFSIGEVVIGLLLALYSSFIYLRSRRDKISAINVNDHWGDHSEAFEKVHEPVSAGV